MKATIVLNISEEVGLGEAINEDFPFRDKLEQNISDLLSSYFLKRISVKLDPLFKGFSSDDSAEYLPPSFVEIEYEY
jgi:hypothetical protein